MANTAHLVRRQSSRDMFASHGAQKSFDRLEMKEMRGRLVSTESTSSTYHSYGATNVAFEDTSPKKEKPVAPQLAPVEENVFAPPVGEEEERESWDSKVTFLLATIGYAVGLGNVWRFPYLAQKNGGGAFLIPYFVMLCIEGLPIFYLELAIGQRLRKGAIGVWSQVSPYLAGIGISSAVVAFNVALYYNTIIAWCLFYLLQSFQSQLPWADCPNQFFDNGSYIEEPECSVSSPTRYFWYRTTLMVSEDINDPVGFNWKIAIALTVAWFLVYLCMMKGIASSTMIVYVTAIFPYIVLIIFFFRGIMLKGSTDGLKHMFTPKWHTLLDPVVWLEAGTQIFFSLGLAFGGLIAFSSYNPVHNNCYRDAVLVSLTNCFTSMFAGVVVFSIIGFKATMTYEKCLLDRNETLTHFFGGDSYKQLKVLPREGTALNVTRNGVSVQDLMPALQKCSLEDELDNSASGTGLAFIIFTEAINQFPYSQVWAVLFFLMLFTLGIDSQFGTLEGVISSVMDMKLIPNMRKDVLTGVICTINAVLSMMFAHGAGSYVFVLFDNFAGNFPLLIVAFFECIAIAYIYGIKRFADDIELMTGSRPHLYWLICWKYISPAAMICIFVASIFQIVVHGSGYDAWVSSKGATEKLEWPVWCVFLIGFLILASVIWIPLVAILRCYGIVIVEDSEKAWFPADELKELYGIMPHEVTQTESFLFCIRPDGSEGLCCPTGTVDDEDDLR